MQENKYGDSMINDIYNLKMPANPQNSSAIIHKPSQPLEQYWTKDDWDFDFVNAS